MIVVIRSLFTGMGTCIVPRRQLRPGAVASELFRHDFSDHTHSEAADRNSIDDSQPGAADVSTDGSRATHSHALSCLFRSPDKTADESSSAELCMSVADYYKRTNFILSRRPPAGGTRRR